jgi:hypothetical protein
MSLFDASFYVVIPMFEKGQIPFFTVNKSQLFVEFHSNLWSEPGDAPDIPIWLVLWNHGIL